MYPVQYLRTASLSGWIPDPARLGRLGEQGMFTLLLSMATPFIRYPTQPSRSPTLLGFFCYSLERFSVCETLWLSLPDAALYWHY
jgi:hypothetical protein